MRFAWVVVATLAAAMLAACAQTSPTTDTYSTDVPPPKIPTTPPPSAPTEQVTDMSNPIVVFETSKGTFEAEIFEKQAPITAGNFLKLVRQGYYDGIIFHRVIPDFMIQGGDPTGTGTGGPGYEIQDEFAPGLKHDKKGMLSMANAGPNTGGSQFFVTVAPTPWLDGKHAIFGKVITGYEVVEGISLAPRDRRDKPVQNVTMTKVYVKQ